MSHGVFMAASDGSVQNKQGTFGWILKKGDTLIAEGLGFAPDHSPSSFHTEACGLLSLLQWLANAPLLIAPNIHITIAIDNRSLVLRMAAHASSNLRRTNDSLLASWAITQRCAALIQAIPGEIVIHWIKGHQDKVPDNTLSPLAQLNIQADKIATSVHASTVQYPTRCPLLPGEGVQLCNSKGTISALYKHILRYQYSRDDTIAYYNHRFGWAPGTADKIDWDLVKELSQSNYKHKKFFIRHSFAILRTAKYANRNNPSYPDKCPFCPEVETNQHFLRCSLNTQWRKRLIDVVDYTVQETNCDIALQELLRDGIRHAFTDLPVTPTQHSPKVTAIVTQQNLIGWTEILRGKFALAWTHPTPGQKVVTTPTLRLLANTILNAVRTAWYACNDHLHGRTPDEKARHIRQNVENEVWYLYTQRPFVHPHNRKIFLVNAETHIASSSTMTLQNWVSAYRPLIQASTKATKHTDRNQRSLTEWLQPAIPPNERKHSTTHD